MTDSAKQLLTGEFQPRLGNRPEIDPYLPKHLKYLMRKEIKPQMRVNKINEESHTVFFFNIPFNSNADHVKAFVSEFGPIANCRIFLQKGQAFVTYYDIRNAINCVEKLRNGLVFDNRKIFANFAIEKQNNEASSVLVFPSVLSSVSDQEIEVIMAQFGEIRSVKAISDYVFRITYFDMRSVSNAVKFSMIAKTYSNVPLVIQVDNNINEKAKEKELSENFHNFCNFVNDSNQNVPSNAYQQMSFNSNLNIPYQTVNAANPVPQAPNTYQQPSEMMRVAYSPITSNHLNAVPKPPSLTIPVQKSLNFLSKLINA